MSWHKNASVNEAVHTYHDNYAKFPRSKIKTASKNITKLAELVQKHLELDYGRPVRYRKIGGTFEGTSICNPPSFDLHYIITYSETDLVVAPLGAIPGHFLLTEVGNKKAGKANLPRTALAAQAFSEKFLFAVYSLKSSSTHFSDINVYPQGPNCIKLNVTRNGRSAFDICLIPGLEITPKQGPINYYVPKVRVSESTGVVQQAWVFTFSHVEKDIYLKMVEKDPRKKCLRIMKALQAQDDMLVDLRSVVLKNVILRQREQGEWSDQSLGLRVLRCLQVLSTAFHTGKLRSVLNQSEELLEELTLEQKSTIYGRLNELISNEGLFMAALKPKPSNHRG